MCFRRFGPGGGRVRPSARVSSSKVTASMAMAVLHRGRRPERLLETVTRHAPGNPAVPGATDAPSTEPPGREWFSPWD